jgi:predicted transcriptional regulator
MSNNYIIQNGELYHYGVKGMKWKNKKGVYETPEEKRQFKQDVKAMKKSYNRTALAETDYNSNTYMRVRERDVLHFNNISAKGEAYANAVMKSAKRQRTMSSILKGATGVAVVTAGAMFLKKYNLVE